MEHFNYEISDNLDADIEDLELNSFDNEIDVSLSSSAYSSNNFSNSSDLSSENEIIQEKNIIHNEDSGDDSDNVINRKKSKIYSSLNESKKDKEGHNLISKNSKINTNRNKKSLYYDLEYEIFIIKIMILLISIFIIKD